MTYDTIREVYSRYQETRHSYESCTSTCEQLVRRLLEPMNDRIVQVSSRTKEPASLRHKLLRKKGYKSLEDVTDICGVRIITYLQEDAAEVCALIEDQFEIDPVNSINKSAHLDPNQFGYQSTHYIVSLDWQRKDLGEYSPMLDRKVEIQVRTALQHAWAAIEHKLVYKSAKETPKTLRRQLSRLSALLEIGDDEFSKIMNQSEEIAAEYSDDIAKGNLDIELNLDSIQSYVQKLPIIEEWAKIGEECGLVKIDDIDEEDIFSGCIRLFRAADHCNIKTLAELHDSLSKADDESRGKLKELFDHAKENFGAIGNYPLVPATLGLVYINRSKFAKEDFYYIGFIHEVDTSVYEIFELEGEEPAELFEADPEDSPDDDSE